MRGTGEVRDAEEEFWMHGEVWITCEKPWDAQGGLGCTEVWITCEKPWDAQGSLGCMEKCGMHREHTGSVAGQGHLAHHVPTVPHVCPGGCGTGG